MRIEKESKWALVLSEAGKERILARCLQDNAVREAECWGKKGPLDPTPSQLQTIIPIKCILSAGLSRLTIISEDLNYLYFIYENRKVSRSFRKLKGIPRSDQNSNIPMLFVKTHLK